MIEVDILILPGKIRRKARVDPTVPLEKIKADIVRALGIGEPDEYTISVSPKLATQPYQSLRPSAGDLIILFKKEDLAGPSVEIIG